MKLKKRKYPELLQTKIKHLKVERKSQKVGAEELKELIKGQYKVEE